MRRWLGVYEYRQRQTTVRTTCKHPGMQAEHAMRMLRKCAYSDVSGDASSGSRRGSGFSESGVPLRRFCLFNRSCVARIVLVATAEKIMLITHASLCIFAIAPLNCFSGSGEFLFHRYEIQDAGAMKEEYKAVPPYHPGT
jgi:hypothetical protein